MLPVAALFRLLGIVVLLAAVLGSFAWVKTRGTGPEAQAQEVKRYFYKIVDVPPDNAAMQSVLNEYGAAGWELVVLSMGDMTQPRLIFKK
ncbi:MAG TPA: hypothetical protein VFS39_08465 [Nitrospira sp.]|nr:hypothetical protein [Nitrospira sp.]